MAPIDVKGSTILCIGLEDKELSPTKVDLKLCADNIPEHNLIDVPELPKSNGFCGASKPLRPVPSIEYTPSSLTMLIPILRKTSMVARQSSPSNSPEIFDVPSAKEDRIIDL